MLPILHLNGYKIANPTVLGRMADAMLNSRSFSPATATSHILSKAASRDAMHQLMAHTLDTVIAEIHAIQNSRAKGQVHGHARMADDHPAHAEGLDRARNSWTGNRSKIRGAHIRCRSPILRRIPDI